MNSDYQAHKTKLIPTGADIEGPFYKAGAPEVPDGRLAMPEWEGQHLCLEGMVLDTDGEQIPGAILDVWQADARGVYDNDGFRLRGKIRPDGKGVYKLETIVPGDYQIADNPPDFRCAHIHFKVSAPGYQLLTTQLYFPDDKYNATDHWFDARRVINDGRFDFVLSKQE